MGFKSSKSKAFWVLFSAGLTLLVFKPMFDFIWSSQMQILFIFSGIFYCLSLNFLSFFTRVPYHWITYHAGEIRVRTLRCRAIYKIDESKPTWFLNQDFFVVSLVGGGWKMFYFTHRGNRECLTRSNLNFEYVSSTKLWAIFSIFAGAIFGLYSLVVWMDSPWFAFGLFAAFVLNRRVYEQITIKPKMKYSKLAFRERLIPTGVYSVIAVVSIAMMGFTMSKDFELLSLHIRENGSSKLQRIPASVNSCKDKILLKLTR